MVSPSVKHCPGGIDVNTGAKTVGHEMWQGGGVSVAAPYARAHKNSTLRRVLGHKSKKLWMMDLKPLKYILMLNH